MKFSKNNPFIIAFFFVGIILPTTILSVLSFRNIQNETFLAKKNFEENITSFKKEITEGVLDEELKILQESKAASAFLYEQPKNLLDYSKTSSYMSVEGVNAFFLFNNKKIIYPNIISHFYYETPQFSHSTYTSLEQHLFINEKTNKSIHEVKATRSIRFIQPFQTQSERTQNTLGIIREHYRSKNYEEALQLISMLQEQPEQQGFLNNKLKESLQLLRFEILMEQKKYNEAQNLSLNELNYFLKRPQITDISSTRFFFESIFNQILSIENLEKEKRETFWNIRENLSRQLIHSEKLYNKLDFLQNLIHDKQNSDEGLLYRFDGDDLYFKMSYPWLFGDQVLIAQIDLDKYQNRILSKVKNISKEWKSIHYTITNANDSILSGVLPPGEIIFEKHFLEAGLNWTLNLYQKNQKEFNKEGLQKKILLYGLIAFSLLTVIFGSFFMLRFLLQEQKLLTMKSNFLSSVSHELKTPLTSIKMFSEMMAKGRVQKTEKIQEYSTLIGKESTRLENLIGAILNYTRMEHGSAAFKWEVIDLGLCVEHIYNSMLDIAIEKKLNIDSHIKKSLFIMGDFTSLYSLVQNLIENAIKYTNPPGSIFVEIYEEDEKIIFSVIDTGIGIPMSEQKNIFNDFYRVGDEMTRSTKGSGLGLAIVKRVVETHKASISLQSRVGKGSTFTVRFKKVR
ncbi:MAG: histidine kinase [Fibrobacter sp.]|nr:histidine kinase [Fibrobacter sp.]